MSDINRVIDWFKIREGKVRYSMTNRLGPNSYDCSSALFNALIAGGYLPSNTFIGNTETLYALEGKLLMPISRSQAQRGDIFVSGVKGGSLGSGGHTGVFLNNSTIIHCTYGKNGIATTPAYQWMGDYSGLPVYCYRLVSKGGSNPETGNKPQMTILVVDGQWGPGTTKRLQEYFGLSIRDGVISSQPLTEHTKNIYSAEFGNGETGSNLIIAMSKWLGINQSRVITKEFVIALQRKMGTIQDGFISPRSDCVRVMQQRLNSSKL